MTNDLELPPGIVAGDDDTAGLPLAGQHVLVTGGAKGIGFAVAEEMAAYGADVTLLGRDIAALRDARERLNDVAPGKVFDVVADLTEPDQITNAFEWAGNMLGPPSVLVNNAGAAASAPFAKLDLAHWNRLLQVNLTGTYLCCQAALPAMVEAGFGRIVNIASTAGLTGYAYVAAYCAAKHGVIGLTRALAREYATKGVTVNAVCPGYVETEMTERTIANIVAKTGRGAAQAKAELAKLNPQGRLVQPDEVAEAAVFLSLATSAAITGQAIAVAGGEIM